MPNLTTIAKWAESMGISRQSGYDAVTRCGIPVVDGKLDPDVAGVLYHKHTKPRANGKRGATPAGADAPASAGNGYDGSRARREEAEATIAEMKLAEMEGKFLVKSEVEDVMFDIARSLRDGLTNAARRIAADVAGMAAALACEEIIDREHRALLASMAQTLQSKLDVASIEKDSDG